MSFELNSIAVLLVEAFFLSFKVCYGDNAVNSLKLAKMKIMAHNKQIFANPWMLCR